MEFTCCGRPQRRLGCNSWELDDGCQLGASWQRQRAAAIIITREPKLAWRHISAGIRCLQHDQVTGPAAAQHISQHILAQALHAC